MRFLRRNRCRVEKEQDRKIREVTQRTDELEERVHNLERISGITTRTQLRERRVS